MNCTIKLKQHTPIIHFQHDQPGATLRATELKPKLDKYLGKTKDERLRYQLRIKPLKNSDPKKPHPEPQKPHPLFFGNQGRNVKKYKQTLFHKKGIELTINTYFDNKLLDKIKEQLPICLALENFGTRQNKGFGCFYLDGKENDIEKILKTSGKPVYYFDVKQGNSFDYIDALYKAMKSGINETFGETTSKAYLKSLLWQYFNQKEPFITWEKRFMKKKLLNEEIEDKPQYLRAVLGLCDVYRFNSIEKLNIYNARPDEDYGDQTNLDLENNGGIFRVRDPKNDRDPKKIKRFKSPITFKPLGNRVYIITDQNTYKYNKINLLGNSFQFKCGNKKGTLKVPDDFSLKGFMDFVMEKVNKINIDFDDFQGKSADALKKIEIQKLSDEGVQK